MLSTVIIIKIIIVIIIINTAISSCSSSTVNMIIVIIITIIISRGMHLQGVSKTFEEHDTAITPALPQLVNHIRSGAQVPTLASPPTLALTPVFILVPKLVPTPTFTLMFKLVSLFLGQDSCRLC